MITIILPVYNESTSLRLLIPELIEVSKKIDIEHKIIFSDNGSKDDSVEIIKKYNFEVFHATKKGYGANLNFCLSKINSKYFIFFDSDGSYDPKDILLYIDEIKKDSSLELISGNRINKNIQNKAMPLLNKLLGTPILSFLIRLFFKIKVNDCNSGMRLLNKSFFDKINLNSPGMEFASEMFIKSSYHKVKFKEIDINFRKDYRGGAPHLQRWMDGWRHLRYIFSFTSDNYFFSPIILSFFLLIYGFILNFFNDPATHLPKFHSIFLLSISANFIFLLSIGLINLRLKHFNQGELVSPIISKLINYCEQNILKKTSLFFLILTVLDITYLISKFIFNDIDLFIELNHIIRIFIYSMLSGYFILLDFIIDINKI